MRRHTALVCIPLAAISVACGGSMGMGGSSGGVGIGANANRESYLRQINDWHEGRIKRLTAEDGWLTLVGLFPIEEGEHTLGSAPESDMLLPATAPAHAGKISMRAGIVTLTPAADVEMTLAGKRIGTRALETDGSEVGPDKIQMGSIQFYVIDRPGSLYLRVKDSESPLRDKFAGIERFKVDSKWAFEAELEPYDPPKRVKVPNFQGFEEETECPGALVFEVDGETYRIEPVSREGDELFVVFGDKTSGDDTYGGGRFVYVDMPGPDGKTVLDFNKAYNPPCVFTTFATCPLPTPGNVLPFRVEAGEKSWGDAHH